METKFKEWDVVVFGATGFTGHFVVGELARIAEEENLSWAVAGRKMHKIQNMLDKTGKRIGKDLDNAQVIIADIFSETSLLEMCQKTKVLINCVGPYNHYGDAVIRACIGQKTDYVDICGESYFLERSELFYNKQARDSGVYIVGGCGFDSIPAEMGVIYTEHQFKGDLTHVDNFIQLHHLGAGITVHAASLESFLIDLSHVWDRRNVRSQLLSHVQPKRMQQKDKYRLPVFYQKSLKSWCLPMINADNSCVERSQSYFLKTSDKSPVDFKAYLCRPNMFWIFGIVGFSLLWGMLGFFSWGWELMFNFPSFFTAGYFTKEGPSIEQINGTSFSMTFEGSGYSCTNDDPSVTAEQKPHKTILTQVTGPEMAYVTTPICLVQAAVVLLKERDQLPSQGGVYPPGAAFHNTNLIQRLHSHNIRFSVIEKP